MKFYEIEDGKLIVYEVTFDTDKLKTYKSDIINNIKRYDEEELFFFLETTDKAIINSFYKESEINIDNIKSINGEFSALKPIKLTSRFRELLRAEVIENYIEGAYDKILPIKTYSKSTKNKIYLNDFLVVNKYNTQFSNLEKRNYYFIDDIICLPENLYTLQVFMNSKIDLINKNNLDLSEIKDLVNVNPLYEFDLDNVNDFFNSGLINESYDDTLKKIDESTKVLRKIKTANFN